MQTAGPSVGQIRELTPDEPLAPGEVELTRLEAERLRAVELHRRVAALKDMRDHHNQRRRARKRKTGRK